MKLPKMLLPLAMALTAAPATAQDGLTQQIRSFADATAGQAAGGDKVMTFARSGGELVVSGMQVIAPGASPVAAQGAAAIIRTRAAPGANPDMPTPADFNFVRESGVRLFVVGEWVTPAIVWEIEPHRVHGVRFRSIDPDGAPGTWGVPVNVPAD